jgi:hypothetical protein
MEVGPDGADQVLVERVSSVMSRLPELRFVVMGRVITAEADELVKVVRDRRITCGHREAGERGVGLVIDRVPDRELDGGPSFGVLWSWDKSQPMRLSTSANVLFEKLMLETGVIV